jgi:GMP synthase (glutamine-hydrolysing)
MRVAVIDNIEYSPLGQVGVALREADAEIQVFRPWAGEALPDGSYHDAMVVLGGDQNALADEKHPYLPELCRLMKRMGQADKAVLGICLGSQLLARAWGGENHINGAPEFGWKTIQLTDAGREDPVLQTFRTELRSFQWHFDTFDLPPGATRLATNQAAANQCFRIGRASYGMQFHFEASRSVIEGWSVGFHNSADKHHPNWKRDLPALAAEHGPLADAAGLAIARAWVSLI